MAVALQPLPSPVLVEPRVLDENEWDVLAVPHGKKGEATIGDWKSRVERGEKF